MKFAIKSLAVAAALAAAGAASAQTVITAGVNDPRVVTDPLGSGRMAQFTLLSGGGDLAFGNGSFNGIDPNTIGGTLGALNVGKIVITGIGGVNVSETFIEDDFGDPIRVTSVASSNLSGLSAIIDGPDAGKIQTAFAVGGARQVGTRITGTLTGGTVDVTGLRFNIAGGQVIADLVGTKSAVGTKPAVVYNSPNTVLWTFDPVGDVVGPTQLKPASLLAADPVTAVQNDGYNNVVATGTNALGYTIFQATANTQLNNLAITPAGAQFFIDALGLLSTGQDALNAVNNSLGKWGSVNSTLTFEVQEVTAVPEPSTYALMGLGLVGISLVARRRAAK